MERVFLLPFIRVARGFLVLLTGGCFIYTIYFFNTQYRRPLLEQSAVSPPETLPAVSSLDAPVNVSIGAVLQSRDLFTASAQQAPSEETPAGQLPANLKVVGIVIADPAEVIIEDSVLKRSYFVSEDSPAGGISIAKVEDDKIIINYQGQNFSLPVNSGPGPSSVQTHEPLL